MIKIFIFFLEKENNLDLILSHMLYAYRFTRIYFTLDTYTQVHIYVCVWLIFLYFTLNLTEHV